MQRYFIDQDYQPVVELTGEAHHHIVRVMRMVPGDQAFLVFRDQVAIKAEITNIGGESVQLKELEKETIARELPIEVTIASGFPKGEKLELIVQKATELGAQHFIAFPAEASVVKWDGKKQKKKQQRLQKIIQEAAEQSHRQYLPDIQFVDKEKELIHLFAAYDTVLVAYEESAKQGEQAQFIQSLHKMKSNSRVLVLFGPEGGLSPREVTAFQQAGAVLCGLGPRILRTETAPLYVMSALGFYYDLLNKSVIEKP
ncbi:ribosomal RNA small subunit methyltransferase E [Enterococcus florum]|uniref:Ribosomal RNA small subunit methyltransferase E n=1 Tax=Enterococcus florum TaxID=2480627 RepID=A0A4P5PIR4_9ENTE|nr:16S rRNA (uracil(1498)-N(3))-methyltransferase [Enterococcus florum]GCF93253.1 ribosomal RNA small subunit methyltransferase E [Enterococcus florum]